MATRKQQIPNFKARDNSRVGGLKKDRTSMDGLSSRTVNSKTARKRGSGDTFSVIEARGRDLLKQAKTSAQKARIKRVVDRMMGNVFTVANYVRDKKGFATRAIEGLARGEQNLEYERKTSRSAVGAGTGG